MRLAELHRSRQSRQDRTPIKSAIRNNAPLPRDTGARPEKRLPVVVLALPDCAALVVHLPAAAEKGAPAVVASRAAEAMRPACPVQGAVGLLRCRIAARARLSTGHTEKLFNRWMRVNCTRLIDMMTPSVTERAPSSLARVANTRQRAEVRGESGWEISSMNCRPNRPLQAQVVSTVRL